VVPHGCNSTSCWRKRTLLPQQQRLPGERKGARKAQEPPPTHGAPTIGHARSTHCSQKGGTVCERKAGRAQLILRRDAQDLVEVVQARLRHARRLGELHGRQDAQRNSTMALQRYAAVPLLPSLKLSANLQQSLAGMHMRITGVHVWQAAFSLAKAWAAPVLCVLRKQQCTQAAQVAPHDSVAHR